MLVFTTLPLTLFLQNINVLQCPYNENNNITAYATSKSEKPQFMVNKNDIIVNMFCWGLQSMDESIWMRNDEPPLGCG